MSKNKLKKRQHTLLFEMKYLFADIDYHEAVMDEAKASFLEAFEELSQTKGTHDVLFPKQETQHGVPQESEEGTLSVFQGEKQRTEVKKPAKSNYLEAVKKATKGEKRKPVAPPKKVVSEKQKAILQEIKTLHKKIAAMTHPDKLRTLSKVDQKHRKEIFMKATEFADKNNLFGLQQISLELGIEIETPTEEYLEDLEKESNNLRKQIKNYKNTYAWIWYHEEDTERKQLILSSYHDLLVNKNK